MGDHEELTGAAVLLSSRAGSYIDGSDILVDGRHIVCQTRNFGGALRHVTWLYIKECKALPSILENASPPNRQRGHISVDEYHSVKVPVYSLCSTGIISVI